MGEARYRRALVRQHIERLRAFRAAGHEMTARREKRLVAFIWRQYRAVWKGKGG